MPKDLREPAVGSLDHVAPAPRSTHVKRAAVTPPEQLGRAAAHPTLTGAGRQAVGALDAGEVLAFENGVRARGDGVEEGLEETAPLNFGGVSPGC